ncbi:MAG: cation-translocating P-type ATPase [Deltaproteobacteria bacterium]|nr:cation-translocating P-type ATPase [Deltaproteobacteria bacterium]
MFSFCCPGCRQVFWILFNSPEGLPADFAGTDLFRAAAEAGLISRRAGGPVTPGKSPGLTPSAPAPESELFLDLSLRIEGMWCPACAWLIEEVLRRSPGVAEASISFPTDLARVKYLPHLVSPVEILSRISSLGYRPATASAPAERSLERKRELVRLGLSAIFSAQAMMISGALYLGFFWDLSADAVALFSWPLLALSTPVLIYGGSPILRRAWRGLKFGKVSMDTLISIGALAAYGFSLVEMVRGGLHLYFDTTAILITSVLLGKYLESGAKEKLSRGIADLFRLARHKVRLNLPGREKWTAPEAIRPGDECLVLAGERAPLDGRVISGRAQVDESILTGESRPVGKKIGDEVLEGTRLLDGGLVLKALRLGRESSLGQMIALLQEALTRKHPMELMADRLMRRFVPAVLAAAAASSSFLFFGGKAPPEEALLRGVTVLVIACPCALGIAIPLAKVAAMSVGRAWGILVRDPAALERIRDLDTLVFDKTGTLTEGNFDLRECTAWKVGRTEALRRVAAVELHSDHYLARAVAGKGREAFPELEPAEDFEEVPGLGVKGKVDGLEIFAGNRRWMGMQGLKIPSGSEQQAGQRERKGETVVFFGWSGEAQGFLVFGDPLKPGAGEVARKLRSEGMDLWLVSGDATETTRAVAEELSIPRFRGQTAPREKVELIKSLQEKGRRVGMIGDGVNDAAALAQADVGVALGSGTTIAREASDLALISGDPRKVREVLHLSALASRTIRQNLSFSILFNAFGVPLAATGFLNPLVAVLAMLASSLLVIGNTLRLSVRSRPFRWEDKRNSGPDGERY